MHDACTRHIGNRWIVMEQRVQHCTIRIASARVDNQAARLIDHQNVIIFIDNRQRDILRFETHFFINFSIDGDHFPT
ncbi:hypothetical protein D3C80_1890270 [compost metagenome]